MKLAVHFAIGHLQRLLMSFLAKHLKIFFMALKNQLVHFALRPVMVDPFGNFLSSFTLEQFGSFPFLKKSHFPFFFLLRLPFFFIFIGCQFPMRTPLQV